MLENESEEGRRRYAQTIGVSPCCAWRTRSSRASSPAPTPRSPLTRWGSTSAAFSVAAGLWSRSMRSAPSSSAGGRCARPPTSSSSTSQGVRLRPLAGPLCCCPAPHGRAEEAPRVEKVCWTRVVSVN